MLKKSDLLIFAAAFMSFLLSISLWFGVIGPPDREAGIFVVYRHGFLGQPGECNHAAGVSANARRTTAGARKPSRSINHCWL